MATKLTNEEITEIGEEVVDSIRNGVDSVEALTVGQITLIIAELEANGIRVPVLVPEVYEDEDGLSHLKVTAVVYEDED